MIFESHKIFITKIIVTIGIFFFKDLKKSITKILLTIKGIKWNNMIELIIKILFEKLKFKPIDSPSLTPGVPPIKKLTSRINK